MESINDKAAGWAIVSSLQFVDALAPLRLIANVEAGVAGDEIWLRSRSSSSELLAMLASVPASRRYTWGMDDSLCPAGSRLATGRFPEVVWQPFSKWLGVALPVAALPASLRARCEMKLVKADVPVEPNALMTTSKIWGDWSVSAPAVRLKPLKFAASFRGSILILGRPLPSIPGTRLVEAEGIIVPASLCWAPSVSPTTVREVLGVSAQCYVLWDEGGVQLFAEELFVAASRAAAKLTHEGLGEVAHE